METIAVYWEPIIKTYGFQKRTGLSLFELSFSAGELRDWGERLQEIGDTGGSFTMVVGQSADGGRMQLSLLMEETTGRVFRESLEAPVGQQKEICVREEVPVELICFQGPHYGDRYGIADAALGTLAENAIAVLAVACVGASIYIVVGEHMAQAAIEMLSTKFAVPKLNGNAQ